SPCGRWARRADRRRTSRVPRASPRRAGRVRATPWADPTTRRRVASHGCRDGRRPKSAPARREGAWLRAASEAKGQIVQAADDEALDVGEGPRVHQPHVVEARQEPFEADAHLGTGETGADTEVLAVTEGDVAPGVRTPCIE